MIFAYLGILFVLFFVPCCIPARKGIHPDYLAPENTLPIKGLFTFFVLLTHFCDYFVLPSDFLNGGFVFLTRLLGQLIVSIFFFYSGYGLYSSVKEKGSDYVRRFPRNRMLPTWLSFAICVLIYVLYDLATRKAYGLSDVMLGLIGWESVGNSNWFMFVTFSLYILFWVSFTVLHDKPRAALLLFTALTALLYLLFCFTRAHWWRATIFCMAAGMWYGYFKSRIDALLQSNRNYWLAAGVVTGLFLCFYLLSHLQDVFLQYVFYNLCAITFCLLILACTMKLTFRSVFCKFLGRHVFGIYILQRLAFAVFYQHIRNPYLFFICSAAATMIAAPLYDKLFSRLKKKIVSQSSGEGKQGAGF